MNERIDYDQDRTMSMGFVLRKIGVFVVGLAIALIGVLRELFASTDNLETSDRPQGDGSDLFGEHNFRTGKADSGTDPYGWYEDDM